MITSELITPKLQNADAWILTWFLCVSKPLLRVVWSPDIPWVTAVQAFPEDSHNHKTGPTDEARANTADEHTSAVSAYCGPHST